MLIDGIDLSKKIMIVAEIGNNHEGSFDTAVEMIKQAAECRVDAVKFQTFIPEFYVDASQTERLARLRSFRLSQDQFSQLADAARKHGLIFFSTPFDIESAEFLNEICPVIKISSGDNKFYPLLAKVASFEKPIIMSTGLARLDAISRARQTIMDVWTQRGHRGSLALLHCVSSYPTPLERAQLGLIRTLQEAFPDTIGYSDHTLGPDAAVLSIGLGARIIEKHFTLDKKFSDFRDHQLSADPIEMGQLVHKIRRAEAMIGVQLERKAEVESDGEIAMRRSIAARRELLAGARIQASDLCWVRPGTGIAPGEERRVVGRTLTRAMRIGEIIQAEDLAD
jgi:N,N'-diacetyllegionaminate synthase